VKASLPVTRAYGLEHLHEGNTGLPNSASARHQGLRAGQPPRARPPRTPAGAHPRNSDSPHREPRGARERIDRARILQRRAARQRPAISVRRTALAFRPEEEQSGEQRRTSSGSRKELPTVSQYTAVPVPSASQDDRWLDRARQWQIAPARGKAARSQCSTASTMETRHCASRRNHQVERHVAIGLR